MSAAIRSDAPFSQMVEDDKILANAYHATDDCSPKNFFACQNSTVGQKFSVFWLMSLGLIGRITLKLSM